jgi:hypothetical protein
MPQTQYGLPAKRNTSLIVGLCVTLGVILLGGGTVGVIRHFNTADAEPGLAQPTPHTTAPPQSDPASANPSGEPSDQPSDATSDATSDQPSDEPSTAPTDTPSTSSRAAPGSPISDKEFRNWKFALGGVNFAANKVAGWTYDTCDPVDALGEMAKNHCGRAIQVAYTAYRGHLKAVQVMMSFPTDKAAKATATRLEKLNTDALNVRRDMTHATYAYGKIRSGAYKKYVVVTIVTADTSAKAKADKFHLYLQADTASYFLLRDTTVTS